MINVSIKTGGLLFESFMFFRVSSSFRDKEESKKILFIKGILKKKKKRLSP